MMHIPPLAAAAVTEGIKTTLAVVTAEMSFLKVSHLGAQA